MHTRFCSLVNIALLAGVLIVGGMGKLCAQISSPPPALPAGPFEIPLIVSKTQDLAFGQIIPAGIDGTLTVSPITGRTMSMVSIVQTSMYSTADFLIYGKKDSHYNISLPASATLSSANASMMLDNFVGVPESDKFHVPPNPRLGDDGYDTVHVGATIHIGAHQASGYYSGAFSVIISYD